jgi:DNA-binding IclR family transcriptional regulator
MLPTSAPSPSPTLRAFSVIELIARSQTPLSLDELTQQSGLPKPTVFRILGLLDRAGVIAREVVDKRYGVGPRLARIALQVQLHSPARASRHAILVRLVQQIGETCNFTIRDGDEVVYLDRVETSSPIRLHLEVGSRVPLHCTASGKLFLAQMTPAHVRRLLGDRKLKRYTERTITDVDALAKALRKVRSEGVGTDVGEYLEGSVCLAVPVADRHGRVHAAVALHGPAPRVTLKRALACLPSLRAAALALRETFEDDDPSHER